MFGALAPESLRLLVTALPGSVLSGPHAQGHGRGQPQSHVGWVSTVEEALREKKGAGRALPKALGTRGCRRAGAFLSCGFAVLAQGGAWRVAPRAPAS